MEELEEKTYTMTPCGEFNVQSFPLLSWNTVVLTEEEMQALSNHTKHWEYEDIEVEIPIYEEQVDSEGKITKVQTGVKKEIKQKGVLKDYTPPAKTEEELKAEYDSLVVQYIREKYSANDENKILREKLAGTEELEFEEYNAYVEECKTKAHNEVYVE
jgi:hypothetical protein